MKVMLSLLLLALLGCSFMEKNDIKPEDQELLKEAKLNFAPLPNQLIDKTKNKELISLGEKLYFETKLSANGKISCNSCHQLDNFGVDNQSTSPGHDGRRGDRNSPTVYNAALHFVQFWDGRAKDVEAQALGPILNPIEHGVTSEKEAQAKINTTEYVAMFKQAFPKAKQPLTFKNIGVAIGAFEKTLITPSRFDDFLSGDLAALNRQEKRGLKKFMDTGCVSCHEGVNIGGAQFQRIGAVNDFNTEDMGRFNVTKSEDDKKFFKVPTLRNIAKTGPYFHDGKVATLEEAIKLMGFHQLGEELTKEDIADIKAFLESLTGKKESLYAVSVNKS